MSVDFSVPMEVESRFIQNDEVGSLHIVTFTPEGALPHRHAIVSNSISGSVLTPDGYGLPYATAATLNTATTYVEFSGSGYSSLPADRELRRDFLKHGTVVLGDAIAETLVSPQGTIDETVDEIHLAGFSLATTRNATLVPGLGKRVVSYTGIDGCGFGDHGTILTNEYRYGSHLKQSRKVMKRAHESVARNYDDIPGFENFVTQHAAELAPHKQNAALSALEMRGIMTSMYNHVMSRIVPHMEMQAARENGRFLMRVGFSQNTFAISPVTIKECNEALAKLKPFIDENDAADRVRFGAIHGGWMGDWHDQTNNPDKLARLLGMPMDELSPKLLEECTPSPLTRKFWPTWV